MSSHNETEHIQGANVITSGDSDQQTIAGNANSIIASEGKNHVVSTLLNQDITIKGKTYKITELLAKSGESEVYLANEGNEKRVIKIYYKNFRPKNNVLQTLLGLKHPDIIPLLNYDYYQGQFCEVLEYAAGGSLEELMPIRDLSALKDIVSETVNALDFCHQNNIIHRDIKPHNIFYKLPNHEDIVIGDFGISSVIEEGETRRFNTTQARTAIYAAPEIFTGVEGKTVIGKEVDYYALGITLLHLWLGEDPFKGLAPYHIPYLKINGKVKIPQDLPQDYIQLISGLITVEANKRWDIQRCKNG